jgi:hypothetical protein
LTVISVETDFLISTSSALVVLRETPKLAPAPPPLPRIPPDASTDTFVPALNDLLDDTFVPDELASPYATELWLPPPAVPGGA